METYAVQLLYEFSVPPELVFDALLNEDLMRKYFFVNNESDIVQAEIQATDGGSFQVVRRDHTTGRVAEYKGEYLLVKRPEKLVFTVAIPSCFNGRSEVVIELARENAITKLTLVYSGLPSGLMEESWRNFFEQLKLTLELQ